MSTKNSIFWDITPCCLLYDGFPDPEDGGNILLRKTVDLNQARWLYISEDTAPHSYHCMNSTSNQNVNSIQQEHPMTYYLL
jgi:hypothetical protein